MLIEIHEESHLAKKYTRRVRSVLENECAQWNA